MDELVNIFLFYFIYFILFYFILFYFILFYFILFYFIVVQVQLSAFPPHSSSPIKTIPTSLPGFWPTLGFVHVSFIPVPENPSHI